MSFADSNKNGEELLIALQAVERRNDLARVADVKYGTLQEVEAAIRRIEESTQENEMLTETVGPEQIAEVVSRWTGIPVTRLGQNEKQRLIGLADRLHQRVVGQDHAVNAVAEAVLSYFPHFQVYGARPIWRWLEKRVVTELSKMLVREEIDENSTVYIDAAPDGKDLVYRVEKDGGLVNATTGEKSDILSQ
ncbi:hypothetical protein RHMOL_Rhmol12G0178000 [Rhododendron molle]|uniref:Uncharacterized protein n=2 Tax=Rhododendron molle TaxID=49168 RepID=A0ACC0LJM7_RHOML|nr:hypothetical protein RHMOL_Rhmol12G0178000 [Rhododendron molle]KAI8528830.1 hypothetical protein RHMOL_Rhmol12G0178000 [Rhododendron molle]